MQKITPIGKTVIIKSLCFAKINHMLSTLRNPVEDLFHSKNRTTLLYQTSLEWQTRSNKERNCNLKLSWRWAQMPYLKKYNFVIEGSLAEEDCWQLFFWKDVLSCYAFIVKQIPITSNQNVVNSALWYHDQILHIIWNWSTDKNRNKFCKRCEWPGWCTMCWSVLAFRKALKTY